jgi:transcriptional regulator with XRE-family HTH domain
MISGQKLQSARMAKGISRSDLAKALGLTYTRVWQMETDAVSRVNELTLKAMCRKLGVSKTELAG